MNDNQIGNAGMGDTPADNIHIGASPADSGGDELRKAVLARLPDLEENHEAPPKPKVSPDRGRLLSAALSKKVLIGCGLALLLVAVVPLLLDREDWKSRRPAPDAEAAPSWSSPDAQATTEGTAGQSADSGAVPQPELPNIPTYNAASEGGMEIEMPDIPDMGMKPSASANRAGAIVGAAHKVAGMRASEQRTNRGATLPLQPGVARLDGTIEKISLRPTYDESRPSVY